MKGVGIQNVTVENVTAGSDKCSIQWDDCLYRFHIWANLHTLDFDGPAGSRRIIYKNPIETSPRRRTQFLNPDARTNAAALAGVLDVVRKHGLVEKAIAELNTTQEQHARHAYLRRFVMRLWCARMYLQPDPVRPDDISELEVVTYSAALAGELFKGVEI